MNPLQMPGGIELLVILLVLLIPVLFIVGLALLVRDLTEQDQGDGRRVEELEDRLEDVESDVESLEAELEELG